MAGLWVPASKSLPQGALTQLVCEARQLGPWGLPGFPPLVPFTLGLGPHSVQTVGVCREQGGRTQFPHL